MSSKRLTPLASIDTELADKLQNDAVFRRRYIRFWAQTEVASEIRTLRKARRMLQSEVAELADTGQSAISRIEKADYDGWTFKTLIGIAEVLRARLRITFEPIEDVVSTYRRRAETSGTQVLTGIESDVSGTSKSADVETGRGTFEDLAFNEGDSSGAKVVVM